MSWSKQDCIEYLLDVRKDNKLHMIDSNIFRIDINPLKNDLFEITLFQHCEELPRSQLIMSDLEFDLDDQECTIGIDIQHTAIIPYQDSRFINQYWAKKFKTNRNNNAIFHGNQAHLSLEEACDMLRYCHSVSNLLAFI